MDWKPIRKTEALRVEPNLADYARTREQFSWAAARRELAGLPSGRGMNIAYEAVDRHANGSRAAKVALRCRDRRGDITDLSYADLQRQTNQFANVLRGLGVGRGDRVFSLLGRVPELYVAALGTLKNGSVLSTLPGLRAGARTAAAPARGCRRTGQHTRPLSPQGGRDPGQVAGPASCPARR
jgi:acetyl-CoA synthetase